MSSSSVVVLEKKLEFRLFLLAAQLPHFASQSNFLLLLEDDLPRAFPTGQVSLRVT